MSGLFQESNPWIKLKDFDFKDKEIEIFHIDTRDFCILKLNKSEVNEVTKLPDYSEIKYIDKYLFDLEEIRDKLFKLMEESGGEEPDWRCLDLKHIDDKMKVLQNWNMKYIRIFKYNNTDKFFVCNNNFYILRRDLFLDSKIIKEHL